MSTPSTDRLNASNLSVGYQVNGGAQATLSQLNLAIRAGEFVCLLGPNGTGKSTLIRTLAGIQAPLGGELKLEGHCYKKISPRERARRVSIVFTDLLPVGMMDAYSFTALGRHPHSGWMGRLSQTDHTQIQWALEAAGAAHLRERQVSELSDGERQKVAIARALAQEARLMLLDEPTAFLDLPRRIELMRLLRDLAHREKIGMLLSTHDLDLAIRYADRLWLIAPDGQLLQGMPEALALSGALQQAFASDSLDWDSNSGSFHAHRNYYLQATLTGSGPAALWTRRGLQRIGIGITEVANCARFDITLVLVDAATQWQITDSATSDSHNFNSIEALLKWICPRRPQAR